MYTNPSRHKGNIYSYMTHKYDSYCKDQEGRGITCVCLSELLGYTIYLYASVFRQDSFHILCLCYACPSVVTVFFMCFFCTLICCVLCLFFLFFWFYLPFFIFVFMMFIVVISGVRMRTNDYDDNDNSDTYLKSQFMNHILKRK